MRADLLWDSPIIADVTDSEEELQTFDDRTSSLDMVRGEQRISIIGGMEEKDSRGIGILRRAVLVSLLTVLIAGNAYFLLVRDSTKVEER